MFSTMGSSTDVGHMVFLFFLHTSNYLIDRLSYQSGSGGPLHENTMNT
jgi:hypothetical protein